MAENKTKPTNVSAAAFIARIADETRRKDCRELVALMRDVTGHPPIMWGSIVGFDQYQYHVREWSRRRVPVDRLRTP